MPRVCTALISVSDKAGIREFAKALTDFGVHILSSGGTASHLREAGIAVTDVSEYTGFPEMMDGRVKTLHPKVHGGLLALRDNADHMSAAERHGITMIDMVVVNLYPFEQTIAKPGIELAEAIENIDIGGPSMVRSAAKNYRSVAIVCNPARYEMVLSELRASGGEVSDATRAQLAVEAFAHTARYDSMIYHYLAAQAAQPGDLPEYYLNPFQRVAGLRYGENPHQQAAFYRKATLRPTGLAAAKQLHGKELSFNNYLDLDTVLAFVREFNEPAAMVVKHNSPCGAALGETLAQAYREALETDPVSAFGGVIGFNKIVDMATAQEILTGIEQYGFMECVLAPGYAADAREALQQKKNLRLLELAEMAEGDPWKIKQVTGGLLVQSPDTEGVPGALKVVTKRSPSATEEAALRFAWIVCKHTKSNAIVIARARAAVGIGGGVTSRVDATHLAAMKAGDRAKGAVLASDAFFPKPDAVEMAAAAGITAIIQPGGSIKDEETIAACDKYGIAMVFTGARHFRH